MVDKSKSIKSFLMQYFTERGNNDIEGIMSLHACYGGTAALFNTVAWMQSDAWDGRLGIVIMTDIAVYEDGSSRSTGGAGSIALLIAPDAPLILEPIRSSHMFHEYDFYKPQMDSEYPTVNGASSVRSYLTSVTSCYKGLKSKHLQTLKHNMSLADYDQVIFHAPFYKQVKKAFLQLAFHDL